MQGERGMQDGQHDQVRFGGQDRHRNDAAGVALPHGIVARPARVPTMPTGLGRLRDVETLGEVGLALTKAFAGNADGVAGQHDS